MIAGHLQIKNDYYYMVLSYLDANGKRKQPWFPTGLPIKNNKKRAEKMLLELRQTYVPPAEHKSNGELSADMLFADFMELWLGVVRNSIEKTTFSSYTQMVKGKIAPYFRKTGIKLGELQARHIQSFYLYELKTVSASTVIHEHANIHKALKICPSRWTSFRTTPPTRWSVRRSRSISRITTVWRSWSSSLRRQRITPILC